MTREVEIAGFGAFGGLLARKAQHAPPPGTPCANCAAPLHGPYCSSCGQEADAHHRSIWKLAWEGVEGLTHLDGRLARTLPPLLFDPGRLARDHFEGRRARHVPPFRLFLITLLIFMFVLEGLFHAGEPAQVHGNTVHIGQAGKGGTNVVFATPAQALAAAKGVEIGEAPDAKTAEIVAHGPETAKARSGRESPFGLWIEEHARRAVASPEYFKLVLFTWAHRLAILLLPILAGFLTLLYVGRRRYYVYDHLIVAMQVLSFVFLTSAIAWAIPAPVRTWAVLAVSVWAPVNLYMILRGAYGSRRIAAALKALVLWAASLTTFGLLIAGLFTLAVAEM